MRPCPDILLVHGSDAHWEDFVGALEAGHLHVQAVSSPAQIELRMRNQTPDVVLLDSEFEHGIDLLLKARQTASGTVTIVVRKLHSRESLYGATLPGESPRYLEPTPPRTLASKLCELLFNPAAPSSLDPCCALRLA